MAVDIINRDESSAVTEVVLRLEFDNQSFTEKDKDAQGEELNLPVDYALVGEVFPFHIVFRNDMMIQGVGQALAQLLPNITGTAVDDVFTLTRPEMEFSYETVEQFGNNQFELVSTQNIKRHHDTTTGQ